MSTEPSTTPDEPTSSSPYIRTFAQDYAALSGKNPEAAAHGKKKHEPKKKKGSKIEPVKSDEIAQQSESIEQQIKRLAPDGAVSRDRPDPEPFSLPRIASGDIVSQEPDRTSILARLQARSLENSDLGPELEPIRPLPEAESTDESPSPLHTYTSDFQDHIQDEHASSFSVLAAEKDAPVVKQKPVAKRNVTGLLAIIVGVVLLIAGAGGLYAAYLYMSKNAPVLSIPIQPSLIAPDSRVMLVGSGSQLLNALAAQTNQPLGNGMVALTYVNESTTTPQGVVEEPSSGGALITELNLQAPNILLRNIDPSSMVGIVSAGGETHPFFILRVTSYERTFEGMLEWEPALYGQLSVLYPEYPTPVAPPQTQTVSTTTTTTPATSTSKTSKTTVSNVIVQPIVPNPYSNLPQTQFIDETIDSHNVRALRDNSGRTLVLYGYVDKQTLIIARNEAAFSLLLGKLEANTSQ